MDPGELEVVITPGRFFSESCERLGRGAGCYDALFARCNQAVYKLGVAYDFQVFPSIPVAGNDVPVDVVVTPSRLITPL